MILVKHLRKGMIMARAFLVSPILALALIALLPAEDLYDDLNFYDLNQSYRTSESSLPQSKIVYRMPKVGAQDDSWSCGINSGSKFLQYHGAKTTYNELRAIRKKDMDADGTKVKKGRFLNAINPLSHVHRLGTPPRILRRLINDQFERFDSNKRVNLYWDQDISDLKNHLENGPVMILIEPRAPYLHWVVVSGYDKRKNEFRISETNDTDYLYSEATLRKRWLKWDGVLDWLPGLGLKEGIIVTLKK